MLLKQSTAVDVIIGPFVDLTDGYTAETGESPSVKLSKNGQALAAKNDATTPVSDADGYYNCELDATDTNTVGTLVLTVAASANALPVRHEFQVVEEAVYDAMYGASAAGPLQSTTAGRTLDVSAGGEAGIDLDNTSGTLSAAQIATDAITADKIAANAIGASELAADALTAIGGGVWDEDATGHQTAGTFGQAIGDPGANTETMYDAVVTDAAGTNVAADVIAVKAETANILVDTGTTLDDHLTDIKGTGFVKDTHSLIDIETYVDILDDGTSGNAKIATDVAAVLVDTNELQGDWTNAGRLDAILDSVLAMLDDARTEPGQGAPPVNPDAMTKLDYLYKAWRNKTTQTATTYSLFDDAGTTVDQKATVSDDGTTATKGEVATGP